METALLAEAQKAERARLHRLAEEQAEKVLEFDRREAEQAARQKEIDAAEQKIRAELLTMRGSELSAVGATVDADLLVSLTNEEFDELLARKTSELEEKKESATQARRERIAQEETSRIARSAEAEATETKRKADAAARIPDREKIVALHNAIAGIPVPQLSPAAQHKQHRVEKLVNALLTSIDVIAGELS